MHIHINIYIYIDAEGEMDIIYIILHVFNMLDAFTKRCKNNIMSISKNNISKNYGGKLSTSRDYKVGSY